MKLKFAFQVLASWMMVIVSIPHTQAFEVNTHERITFRAIGASGLDNFLRGILSFEFSGGVLQTINGKPVEDWITLGSKEEDSPDQRVQHHFHDPTKPWNQAGPITGGLSSVIWSQLENQGNGVGGGDHSWKDARASYFRALTGTTTAQRQQDWAETFQSLGNLMHLIQDAASPAHSRNDLHFSYKGIGDTDRLHVWGGKEGIDEVDNSAVQGYDPSILSLAPNSFAPVPIARIIDTEKLRAGIASEGIDIGIAEYSNANFFSDDTIFSSSYETPADLGLITEPGPNGKPTHYLYRHPGSPTTRYRLGLANSLADSVSLPFWQQRWVLDDFVMEDYGKKLFPRAIGYSAGLIDYFFRGQIDSALQDPNFILVPWEQRPTSLNASVKISTPPAGQETGTGTIRLVLLHYSSFKGSDPGDLSPGPKPVVVVSDEVPFTISSQHQNVTFPFASLPFPTIAPDTFCCYGNLYMGIIVYKGTLGQEMNNAIVASGYCHYAGSEWHRYYTFERDPTNAYIGIDC